MRCGFWIMLTMGIATTASSAEASWPVTATGTVGPASATGIGAGQFSTGTAYALEIEAHPAHSAGWILRAGRTTLTRTPARPGESGLTFFSGGQLYVPVAPDGRGTPVGMDQIEVGLRRGHPFGRFRPYAQGTMGVSLTRDDAAGISATSRNDRRPDPASASVPAYHASEVSPSLSLGLGVEVATLSRLGLTASVAADFAPLREMVGTVIPVRFGATWPVAGNGEGGVRTGAGTPRLRISGGWSTLRSPARLRGGPNGGLAMAAEMEVPLGKRIAFSLMGEHLTEEYAEPLYRQELDAHGNLTLVQGGSRQASLSATLVTAGARAFQRIGPARLSVRCGLGWGRTGGFGATYRIVDGAFIGPNGEWVPADHFEQSGIGSPVNGWAYTLSAGAESRAFGAAAFFAELGASGLELERENFRSFPIRAGVALR